MSHTHGKFAGTTAAPSLSLNLPGTSGLTPFLTLMTQPVSAPISRAALDAMITGTGIYETPIDVLEQAHAAQQREVHNEAIDKRNAKKRQMKKLAKDAGVSPATLRRMMGRA